MLKMGVKFDILFKSSKTFDLFSILLICLFSFSCIDSNTQIEDTTKGTWKDQQIRILLQFLDEKGMKNVTSDFKKFLSDQNAPLINEYMNRKGYDSAVFVPGNFETNGISKKIGLKLPHAYTPEDNNLIIFKRDGFLRENSYK